MVSLNFPTPCSYFSTLNHMLETLTCHHSEVTQAEKAEMQSIQLQINNLSDELTALEGSFHSLSGEDTQRKRYESVTTESKLRIEFADTRSTYKLQQLFLTSILSVKLIRKFKARISKFTKEKEEVEYVQKEIAKLIDRVKKLEEKEILMEQLKKPKKNFQTL